MPVKVATKRAVNNENDENMATTRLTRAKAAARGTAEPDLLKKGLARSKSTTAATANANLARKRAALGDVSNVAKNDVVAAKDSNDAKKPLAAKSGLVSKAAQPSKVQKHGRSQSSKSILAPKNKNALQSDLKRPHPSGGAGHASKKRMAGSASSKVSVSDDVQDAENIAPVEKNLQRATDKMDVHAEAAQSFTPKDAPVTDLLDDDDLRDPTMVAEYASDIFKYMKEIEPATMPNHSYMEQQEKIDWRMRGILVDWLVEVHTRFKLLPETLFLAVNILDRFLSRKLVQVDKLQLVGVTAMFLAAKYEEVMSPHVSSFRHVSDDGFTDEEILNAERYLLLNIDYDLSYPNPLNFLRRISKPDGYDVEARTLGKYLLEISCVDHRFMRFPGSQIAAAAMYLSRLILDRGEWHFTIAEYAGYTEEELKPCFYLMLDYLSGPVKHDALFTKYARNRFKKASIVVREWVKANGPDYLRGLPRKIERLLDSSRYEKKMVFHEPLEPDSGVDEIY